MQPEYVKINLHGLKCLNSKWNKLFFNTEFIVPQDIQLCYVIVNICSQFYNKHLYVHVHIGEIKWYIIKSWRYVLKKIKILTLIKYLIISYMIEVAKNHLL